MKISLFITNLTVHLVINEKDYTYTCSNKDERDQIELFVEYHNNLAVGDVEGRDEIVQNIMDFIHPKEKELKKQLSDLQQQHESIENEILTEEEKYFIFDDLDEFYVDNDHKVYLEPYRQVSIPDVLVSQLASDISEGNSIEYLKNFWIMCLANPDSRARSESFKYIQRNGMSITSEGYLVTYRRVNSITEETSLSDFVSSQYAKIKRWKKSPAKYVVVKEEEDFGLVEKNKDGEPSLPIVGALDQLYRKLDKLDDKVYRSAHDPEFEIKIGVPARMDRGRCDPSGEKECSRGLHVGTPDFVNDGYHGNVPILALVNPQHIVSIPYSDCHKMRVCEYYPACILETDKYGNIIPVDPGEFEMDYKNVERKELEEMLDSRELEEFILEGIETNKGRLKRQLESISNKLNTVKLQLMPDSMNNELSDEEKIQLIKNRLA